MKTKTFNNDDIFKALGYGGGGPLEIHKEFDWVSEGKYETCEYILKEEATGNFYRVHDSRSGSYYSDWYYDSEDWGDGTQDLVQVELKEVVTTKWVSVG